MKRVVLGLGLVTLLAAAPAQAAGTVAARPADKITVLQRQIKTMQAQIKSLTKQVGFLTSEVAANYVGDACSDAATAAIFQGTWATLDQKFSDAPPFGGSASQTPVTDKKSCRNISVATPKIDKPPSVNIFNDIISWLVQ